MDFELVSSCGSFTSVGDLIPLFLVGAPIGAIAAALSVALREHSSAQAESVIWTSIERTFRQWNPLRCETPPHEGASLQEGLFVRLQGRIERANREDSLSGLVDRPLLTQTTAVDRSGRALGRATNAVDAVLVLSDGQRVRIAGAEASRNEGLVIVSDRFAKKKTSLTFGRAVWTYDQAVLPGDIVEALGHLRREVDVRAQAPGLRSPPFAWILCASEQQPVTIYSALTPIALDPPMASRTSFARAAVGIAAIAIGGGLLGFIVGRVG